MTDWITAWLTDQCIDYPDRFPSDFDFDSAVDQLIEWFDDQLVNDHLDDLLRKLLQQIAPISTRREQLMEDIDCIIESNFGEVECKDDVTKKLCDAVCKHFPVSVSKNFPDVYYFSYP
jgi:hypothetical protein